MIVSVFFSSSGGVVAAGCRVTGGSPQVVAHVTEGTAGAVLVATVAAGAVDGTFSCFSFSLFLLNV